ncbi:MAG: Maf family protein, partial [Bifidobacteriaceae bacterium]|nr:Maf family protein [Bifidobacteriaceae bacterium]
AGLKFKSLPSVLDEKSIKEKVEIKMANSEKVFDKPFEYIVKELAKAKAYDIFNSFLDDDNSLYLDESDTPLVVLGCDSMYEFEGKILGKPKSDEEAFEMIKSYIGKSGVLHTGHYLITKDETARITVSTKITFGDISDEEIWWYIKTGEPRKVAGAFAIDSFGSAYISEIEGDYHNIVGVSVHAVRNLFKQCGLNWLDYMDPSLIEEDLLD